MAHKVSIHIVTYNNLADLPACLLSLKNQTFKDFKIIIVDNLSLDGTKDYVEKTYPEIKLVINNQNLGFARAHNQAIQQSESPFVFIINPDIILETTCLEKLVNKIETNNQISSTAPKLLKLQGDLKNPIKTDIIDTTGILMLKNRRVIDRGQNEKDTQQYDQKTEIFGPSGAAALYRRQALEDVAWQSQYFDDDFFAFKEDVDLAWRLKLRNWQSFYVPAAIGFHRRSAGQFKSSIIKNRQMKTGLINYLSYRNHLFTLYKNETLPNLFWYFPYIFWYELKKFLYILFLERKSLKAIKEFFHKLPALKEKRRYIMSRIIINQNTLKKFFK